jgi:L-ascorbate metabolism protein UlaG (beta-lactamase superfamily)
MNRIAAGNAFFDTSGSSPPADVADPSTSEPGPIEARPLPPELIEDLAAILASALVADIRQFPNLADLKTNPVPTVESPRGHDRSGAPSGIVAAGRKTPSGVPR